jgi:hypothetical protein
LIPPKSAEFDCHYHGRLAKPYANPDLGVIGRFLHDLLKV